MINILVFCASGIVLLCIILGGLMGLFRLAWEIVDFIKDWKNGKL